MSDIAALNKLASEVTGISVLHEIEADLFEEILAYLYHENLSDDLFIGIFQDVKNRVKRFDIWAKESSHRFRVLELREKIPEDNYRPIRMQRWTDYVRKCIFISLVKRSF